MTRADEIEARLRAVEINQKDTLAYHRLLRHIEADLRYLLDELKESRRVETAAR